MTRLIVAVALLFLFAVSVPGQPDKTPAKKERSAEPQSPPSLPPEHDNIPAHHAEHPNEAPPKWYAALERPDWWLVVIAGITGFAIFYQAREMKDATDVMRGQLKAMQDQIGQMQESGRQTDKLIEAAQKGADASKASVELVINKERARIRVEMDKPWLEVGSAHLPEYPEVRYRVEIYGPSAAFIEDHEASAYTADSPDAPPPYPRNVPMGLDSVINANAPPIKGNCFIFPKMKLDQSDVDKLHGEKSFLHFRGAIRYKDVFGKDRHTTFKYVWKVGEPFKDGTPFGYWLKCGKQEENEET